MATIAFISACKKTEYEDEKVGGCYDLDSPLYDKDIDYDDGTCKYAYVTAYEITKHPEQDPANSGTDWDLITNTEADLLLTVKTQIDQKIIFQSVEMLNHTYNVPAKWTAPVDIQLFNQNYTWELYDADDLDADDFIASGVFNPLDQIIKSDSVYSTDTNSLNKVTFFKLYFDVK